MVAMMLVMMMVMVMVMMVMSVRANVSDDDDEESDGGGKERVWDDDVVHGVSTITDDATIADEWVMSQCACVIESGREWLMMNIANDHDGIMA
eukprot:7083266-Pyramimonas_sp.AAC.1